MPARAGGGEEDCMGALGGVDPVHGALRGAVLQGVGLVEDHDVVAGEGHVAEAVIGGEHDLAGFERAAAPHRDRDVHGGAVVGEGAGRPVRLLVDLEDLGLGDDHDRMAARGVDGGDRELFAALADSGSVTDEKAARRPPHGEEGLGGPLLLEVGQSSK